MRSVTLGEAVGVFLLRYLRAHNITQMELSKRCGLPQSTLSAIIRGARGPRACHIDAVLAAIGVSLADFAVELLRVSTELAAAPAPMRAIHKRRTPQGETLRDAKAT